MAINSLMFLGFVAAVCVVAYMLPPRFRYIWLLVASVGFFLFNGENFTSRLPGFFMMLIAAFASYFCAIGMQGSEKKRNKHIYLIITLVVCLGLLVAFKYLDFISVSLAQLLSLGGTAIAPRRFDWILPLGISYYTMQTVSYIMDVYRGKYPAEKNFLLYLLYVCFFPGIVTGPINRADKMLPQYKDPPRFNYDRVAGGLFRVLWGIFKKMVIADNIATITTAVYTDPEKFFGPQQFVAMLLFTYQLYTDFSGSCDIVIGVARMLGFDFMENFKRPLAAKTMQGLWRRWHISLTSFFRDYLYIPLGGNRVSKLRLSVNTLIIFTVSGLWHGAHVGYILWGFVCGAVLVAGRLFGDAKERLASRIPVYSMPKVRGFFQRVFVYLIFSVSFIFFALALYGTPADIYFTHITEGWRALLMGTLPRAFTAMDLEAWLLAGVALAAVLVEVVEKFAVNENSDIAAWIRTRGWYLRWPLYYGLLIVLLVLGAFGKSDFIYQQY